MTQPPRLLFVPASGAEGAGEYFRCLTIAHAVRERWPDAAIRFIVNREAGYARDAPFAAVAVDGSPTFNTAVVNRTVDEHRPDVIVFDSAGRLAQLVHAQRAGAATVYVSSRYKTRWKGFRLRRMRRIDQHWLASPRFLGSRLTLWERAKLALLGRPEIEFLDPVRPVSDPARAAALLHSLGLAERGYVLFTAGGGGYRRAGMAASDVFGRAALEVHRRSGRRVIWVRGPNYKGAGLDGEGVLELGGLRPDEMQHLMAEAEVAVINGGSLLLQAVGSGTVAIAAPIAGDQPRRIDACARRGLAVAAALETEALARTALLLLEDPAQQDRIRQRLRQLALRNGAEQAVDALARLLARPKGSS